MDAKDIAIIGMECVFPGAGNLAQYWDNLVDGVDAIGEIPAGRLNGRNRTAGGGAQQFPCTRGGFLPAGLRFDPLKFGIMPSIVPHGDPDQFLMLQVIAGALADAGVAADHPLRQSTDVIIGRGGYLTNKMAEIYYRADVVDRLLEHLAREPLGLDRARLEQLAGQLQAAIPHQDVDAFSTCIPNLVASRAANRLNLRGTAYTVDAACASSLLAVEHAVHRLRDGLCDLAVASGIFLCQTPGFWYLFTELGAISPSQQIRPFDRQADGLLIGEGAAAVILKRVEDARRDGDRIYAIVKGVGTSSDGRDTHILSPSSRGQVAALRAAYDDARIDPATIGYLEAHGTGTIAGDLAELQTIQSVFGARGKYPPLRPMGSVKSMIGHTMPAAGMASLIKTALCLSNKCLVPSLHCDDPHAEVHGTPFYINRETRPWIHGAAGHPRRAGVNAFGFGGVNAHVILEEVPAGAASETHGLRARPHRAGGKADSELLLLSASSPEALAQRLQALEQFLARPPQEAALAEVAFTLADEVDFQQPCKLALVPRDREHLGKLIATVLAHLQGSLRTLDGQEGIYYSPRAPVPLGKIAGIFPGIGFPGLIGTYPGHLMELCRHFPEVRQQFDRIELREGHPEDPIPTSLIFSPPSMLSDPEQQRLRNRIAAMEIVEAGSGEEIHIEPRDRNIAGSAVTLSNWVSWLVLQELHVPVEMVCGQSQGEIAAMCAAGIVGIDEITARFWQALSISPNYLGQGRLALVGASAERLAPFLAESPDSSVAIHIAPELLVIGGLGTHIASVAKRLRAQGIIAKELPHPPIHTPRLTHMRDEIQRVIDLNLRLLKPKRPIYSAITAARFPDTEDEIRELALCNLDRPVQFWQTVHQMYADGARIFIQVGGGAMASNIRTILPRPDILGTGVDAEQCHPVTQLHLMCAALFAAGVRYDPAYLYRDRDLRKLDWHAPPAPAVAAGMLLPLRMDWEPLPAPGAEPRGLSQVSSDETVPFGPAETAPLPDSEAIPDDSSAATNLDLPTAAARVMPLLGEVVTFQPERQIITERILDLDTDVCLQDHALLDASCGKPVENRGAVVPMMMMLEAAAETAACLAPGLGVIGFERIIAYRWIDFRDVRTLCLRVTATLESIDAATGVRRVQTEIASDGQRSAAVVVLLGAHYREDVQLQFTELRNPRPWPLSAAEMYTERHMFHGPQFQSVSGLEQFADQGLTGQITVLPKDRMFAGQPDPQLLIDPAVLDGVAQMLGMWVLLHGMFLMPTKITKMEFYGTAPPPGTCVPVHIEVRAMNAADRTVTADAEVQNGSGAVWFRLEGMNEWTYSYSPQLKDTQRLPARYHLATPYAAAGAPAGSTCVLLSRGDLRHAVIEWLTRLFLHLEETGHFEGLRLLPRKWQWLMGRIAAKDAARLWLAQRSGGDMIHPALLQIAQHEQGQPVLLARDDCPPMPYISIAHTEGWAAAMAADAACGIDIEPVARDMTHVLAIMANAEELEALGTLAEQDDQQAWPLRLWCAKEAVGKALGTGLDGRPGDFQLSAVETGGLMLIYHQPTACTYTVHTMQTDALVLACATLAEAGPQSTVWDETALSALTTHGSLP